MFATSAASSVHRAELPLVEGQRTYENELVGVVDFTGFALVCTGASGVIVSPGTFES
jgi:hypothetical protein